MATKTKNLKNESMNTWQTVSSTHSISAALYDKQFEFCMHWRERQLTCTETERALENDDT